VKRCYPRESPGILARHDDGGDDGGDEEEKDNDDVDDSFVISMSASYRDIALLRADDCLSRGFLHADHRLLASWHW